MIDDNLTTFLQAQRAEDTDAECLELYTDAELFRELRKRGRRVADPKEVNWTSFLIGCGFTVAGMRLLKHLLS